MEFQVQVCATGSRARARVICGKIIEISFLTRLESRVVMHMTRTEYTSKFYLTRCSSR